MEGDAFSSESFNAYEWTNIALRSRPVGEQVEVFVASLLSKLQVNAQNLNDELDDCMERLLDVVPSARNEIGIVERKASALQQRLQLVSDDLDSVDSEKHDGIESLAALDDVKNKMKICCETLREAANWGRTTRVVTNRLSEENFDVELATDEICSMQRSLKILSTMPEAEARQETMRTVQAKLNAVLRPQLQAALLDERSSNLQKLVDVFRRLGQEDSLKQEYLKTKQASLHKSWFSAKSEQQTLMSFLPKFHARLLDVVRQESRRLPETFGRGVNDLLCDLLVGTLVPLQPSLTSWLEEDFSLVVSNKHLSHSVYLDPRQFFQQLLQVHDVCCNFVVDLHQSLRASPEQLKLIIMAVMQGFDSFRNRYTEIESAYIRGQVESRIQLDFKRLSTGATDSNLDLPFASGLENDTSGQSQAFLQVCKGVHQSIPQIFEICGEAVQRCGQFSGGALAPHLLQALSTTLLSYMSKLAQLVRSLRLLMGLSTSPAHDTSPAPSSASTDWSFLQACLQLLQIAGELTRAMSSFDTKLRHKIKEQCETLFEESADDALRSWKHDKANIPLLAARFGWKTEQKGFLELHVLYDRAINYANEQVMPDPARALKSWLLDVNQLLFDFVFEPVRRHVKGLSSLKAWNEQQSESPLLSYGFLPQSYATSIGEHLLSFLQQVEPFSSSEGLSDALIASEYVMKIADTEWQPFIAQLRLSSDEKRELHDLLQQSTDSALMDDEEEHIGNETGAPFVDRWTSVLAHGIAGTLLSEILVIPNLGAGGRSQLNADLDYLVNVFSAVGVVPHPLVTEIKRLLAETSDTLTHNTSIEEKFQKAIKQKFQRQVKE